MSSTITDIHKVRSHTKTLLESLCKGLYEREEAMRLSLLSAVAGESIFLLGPPGVGKSLIARRLKYAFRDGTSFEYLMSKFSTPDEIFGPVSIKKLKEEDKYERLTDRYLPSANIVFLDEIWKAGPAIQNALLTILNEKIYRNGGEDIKVDIRGIITASNELPPKNSSLDPIWDRFLLRLEVGNIRKFRNFLDMITDVSDVYEDDVPDTVKLTQQQLDDWSREIDAVELPAEVLNTIQVTKLKLDEHNTRTAGGSHPVIVHDRRWKKIVRLMRTSAFLNGRKAVNLMDCFLMIHCLWSHPEQKDKVQEIITEAVRQHSYTMAVNLQMVKQEAEDFENDVDREIKIRHTVSEEQLMPIDDEYFQLNKDDNRFEGIYVPIKQYRNLKIGEAEVVNFYDKDKNLVNRLKAEKSTEEHTIEVYYNSVRFTYPLRTRKAERTEVIMKPPHEIVQKHWDERHQRLMSYIDAQLAKMEEGKPAEMSDLQDNLFVNQDFSEVVLSNFREVAESLQSIRLRLEQLQYTYTNV
ncbi:AAA family ATPase [Flavilitoribacter nigricans]|uniref:ATPase n=1 Tax=Flavilitoribacter nigricans (strain ATCC 23147 / DSM 23189 / NBRC 102662 / NCIMB 1420 / SS-2) TaxID=1122177 RepID=A0A2D0NC32_FLAN2|nr:AAA family ATPase [Flavilitoribacter nigricans]PHN06061.1 ATPase [Flavilitoribacter nigricans DSM 23189 = NBRC 102662]